MPKNPKPKKKKLTKRPPTIHIMLEFRDSRLRLRNLSKLDNTTSFRARPVEQNLSELDLTSRLEQFDEIFVGG